MKNKNEQVLRTENDNALNCEKVSIILSARLFDLGIYEEVKGWLIHHIQ